MTDQPRAHPPETTEGWYAFHQVLSWDKPALHALEIHSAKQQAERELTALATPSEGGWTAVVPLIGSRADVMLIHFRATLDGSDFKGHEILYTITLRPLFFRLDAGWVSPGDGRTARTEDARIDG